MKPRFTQNTSQLFTVDRRSDGIHAVVIRAVQQTKTKFEDGQTGERTTDN